MTRRFVEPSNRGVYGRIYSAREVAAYAHRFGHPEESVDRMEWNLRLVSQTWRRMRLRVDALWTVWDEAGADDPEIAPYVARRLRGSRFPAIVVEDPGRLPLDGNHRVRAAQIVGDEWIDAFVPSA